MVTAMTTIGIASYIQHDSYSQYRYNHMTKARYVALGAVDKIRAKLQETPGLLASPTSEMRAGTIGGNTYRGTYAKLSDGTTRIKIEGICQKSTETIYLYAKYKPAIGGSDAFDKALQSENDVNVTGNSDVKDDVNHNANVHSNHDATVGGSATLDGNVTAVGTATSSSGVTGTTTSNAPYEPFPRLNYDYYHKLAEEAGTVYTGDQKFIKTTLNPASGVIWVDGDVFIGNRTTINGCLVATGTIKTTANGCVFMPQQLPDGSNAPALISLGGDITMTAQNQLVGLVYAGSGSVKFTGSWKNELRGAICAWDDIQLTGGAGLTYDPDVVKNLGSGVVTQEESIEILAMER